MIERLNEWWTAGEGKLAAFLAAVALGRYLYVQKQIAEGKRELRLMVLVTESGGIIAGFIMAMATMSVITLLFDAPVDDWIRTAIALGCGWLGLNGAWALFIRFLQKRGILPEETK